MATQQSNRGKTGLSPANLQKYLKGADYPSAKDELMRLAENNGATEEILDLFASMPDVEFESPAEVQECYGHIIGDVMEEQGKEGGSEGRSGGQSGSRRQQYNSQEEEDEDFDRDTKSYNERRTRRQKEQQDDDDAHSDKWDHRLKGHETKAIKDAREMKHGYDGRGRVTDPETDQRLADNASPAIDDARRMKHGYDGRGRVKKMGDEPGETIAEARERYEERRQENEPEIDPETGSHSRRRQNDEGEIIRGSGQTFEQWLQMVRQRQGGNNGGKQQSKKRQTWRQFSGKK